MKISILQLAAKYDAAAVLEAVLKVAPYASAQAGQFSCWAVQTRSMHANAT
jgi:hypothetical protein